MKLNITKSLCLIFLGMTSFFTSNACVDPDTTIVNVTVSYDTINAPLITEVDIRLSNLRLMNEAPNKVCACALTQWSDLFTNLKYIVFVEAGTNTPYAGFAAFDASSAGSDEWNSTTGSGDWSGYIATVINSGLSSTVPVDLIIRASTPSGVQYFLDPDPQDSLRLSLITAVESESLGTDEWNPTTNKLVDAHRGIQGFAGRNYTYVAKPSTYFTALDKDIEDGIKASLSEITAIDGDVKVFPNPFDNQLNLQFNLKQSTHLDIRILDMQGKEISAVANENFEIGEINIDLSNQVKDLEKGSYLIQIETDKGSIVKHLFRQ